jgi:hypothetical protein
MNWCTLTMHQMCLCHVSVVNPKPDVHNVLLVQLKEDCQTYRKFHAISLQEIKKIVSFLHTKLNDILHITRLYNMEANHEKPVRRYWASSKDFNWASTKHKSASSEMSHLTVLVKHKLLHFAKKPLDTLSRCPLLLQIT